jgi:putative colanic acid biosynthesis acetyltransferase WcaF
LKENAQYLEVKANRLARKWTRKELAGRVFWALAQPLFSVSPRPLWGWRRFILRCFGARIAQAVHIYPSVSIAIPWNVEIGAYSAVGDRAILYSLGTIRIGERATISQGAHLCAGTHDYIDPALPLLKPPIIVGAEAWVCADAFIGPGVTVGDYAIVGARAVAMKDVPAGAIVVGNPARFIKKRELGIA